MFAWRLSAAAVKICRLLLTNSNINTNSTVCGSFSRSVNIVRFKQRRNIKYNNGVKAERGREKLREVRSDEYLDKGFSTSGWGSMNPSWYIDNRVSEQRVLVTVGVGERESRWHLWLFTVCEYFCSTSYYWINTDFRLCLYQECRVSDRVDVYIDALRNIWWFRLMNNKSEVSSTCNIVSSVNFEIDLLDIGLILGYIECTMERVIE